MMGPPGLVVIVDSSGEICKLMLWGRRDFD